MRWINRIIILLLVLLAAQQWLLPSIKGALLQDAGSAQHFATARASNFYPLYKEKWLEFDIANQARIFRFYFHASLLNKNASSAQYQLKPQHSYQVTYQWLASNGDVLSTHEYNINTRITPNITVMDTDTDKPHSKQVPLRFYGHQRSQPSLDQSLYLDPSTEPKATTLRFHVTEMDSSIEYIGVRSYLQHQRNPQDIDVAWQRMSREKRDLISSPSVYPSFLISNIERHNVMAKYWKPIGPIGVLDKDYRIETLYLRENNLPLPPAGEVTPKGIFASPSHWASVRLVPDLYQIDPSQQIPQTSASNSSATEFHHYKLQWLPYFKQGLHPFPSEVKLHWQGVNTKKNHQWKATITDGSWQGKLRHGLLKIIPNGPGIFKVSKKINGQWLDITPQTNRFRAYLCIPSQPLLYDIGADNSLQSLKITARGFQRTNELSTQPTANVHITSFNHINKIVSRNTLPMSQQSNAFAHFTDVAKIDSQINESVSRHFDIKSSVKNVRISCSSPVLVNISTRPFRHPVTRNLPSESNPWLTYETREPTWFSLQPKDQEVLIVTKRYFSVLWYFEPVEINPAITSGRFTWKALPVVTHDAFEKELFTPVSKKDIRQQARSVSYRRVKDRDVFEFAGKHDQASINVNGVYIRNKATPKNIEIWIDDKLSVQTTIAGKSGKIPLPAIKPGTHTVEFRPGGVDWYINNLASGTSSHMIRTAHTLTKNKPQASSRRYPYSLTFDFEVENPPQTISIWLYAPKSKEDLECQVSLKASHIKSSQPEHSFRDYRYKIAVKDYPLSKVLRQKGDVLHGPIPLYVALNKDMPDQTGQVVLSCNKANILASSGIISDGLSTFYNFRERVDDP